MAGVSKKKAVRAKKQPAAAARVIEAAEAKPKNEQGPPVYLNWLWSQRDEPLLHIQEFPLYTDAHIVAETKHGPYEFLNTLAMIPGVTGIVRPAVILRYELYWTFPYPDFSKTNTDKIGRASC